MKIHYDILRGKFVCSCNSNLIIVGFWGRLNKLQSRNTYLHTHLIHIRRNEWKFTNSRIFFTPRTMAIKIALIYTVQIACTNHSRSKHDAFSVLETIINQAWFDKMHNWMKFDVKRRRNPDRDGWLIEWWNAQSSKAADNRNRGCARAKTRASDAQLIDIPTNWCLTRLIITTGRSVPDQRI